VSAVLDVAGGVLVVLGALLALAAAVGLLRLPGVLSRMHAATAGARTAPARSAPTCCTATTSPTATSRRPRANDAAPG
jgi:monovalent cation/proton antiporter MnhG/PhaG subunit